jgi:hypothetical protein
MSAFGGQCRVKALKNKDFSAHNGSPGRSHVRELRLHGSVRGAAGNGRPYREPFLLPKAHMRHTQASPRSVRRAEQTTP